MYVAIHAKDELKPKSEGNTYKVYGNPIITFHPQRRPMLLFVHVLQVESLGSGERGGTEREIHRQAEVWFREPDLVELFHALAEHELPKLPVADALRLAVQLIQGALAEQAAPPST